MSLSKYIETHLQHLFDLFAIVILTPACVNRVCSASTFKMLILEKEKSTQADGQTWFTFLFIIPIMLVVYLTCVRFLFKGIVIRSWEANDLRSYRSMEHTQVLYILCSFIRRLLYQGERDTAANSLLQLR